MTLKDRCLCLPYLERLNLCAAIQGSILQERRDRAEGVKEDMNRGEVLLRYMAEIFGWSIPEKSRESRFVWARTMVAYQLTLEGYTTTQAGKMMGKDHSTIIHMRKKMQDALDYPYAYKDIIDIWKQFQNKIDNEIHRRTTQDIICMGGQFPDCSESTMGQESGESRTPGDL